MSALSRLQEKIEQLKNRYEGIKWEAEEMRAKIEGISGNEHEMQNKFHIPGLFLIDYQRLQRFHKFNIE